MRAPSRQKGRQKGQHFSQPVRVLNHIPEGLLGTCGRVAEVTCAYKPRECQSIRHNFSLVNIYIGLFSKLAPQWCTSHRNYSILVLCKKYSAGREILYRVRKPGAFLSSCEPRQRRRRWRQMPKTAVVSYVSMALPNM